MANIVGDIAISVGADISPLKTSLGQAAAETDRFAAKTTGMGRAMGAVGGNAKQLAMQLSQVGQQTMATGNFVQALAIQLPDIGLAFGAVGTAAGLVAGVALPMVIGAFSSTGDSSKELSAALDEVKAALTAYGEATKAASTPMNELSLQFGVSAEAARELNEVLEANALERAMSAIAALNVQMAESFAIQGRIKPMALAEQFDVMGWTGIMEEAKGKVFELKAAIEGLNSSGTLQEQEAAARRLLLAYTQMADASGDRSDAEAEFIRILGDAVRGMQEQIRVSVENSKAVRDIQEAAEAAAKAMEDIGVRAAGIIGRIQAAATAAWDIASASAAAADNIRRMNQNNGAGVYGQVGARGDPRKFMNGRENPENNTFNGSTYTPKKTRGGGGGASAESLEDDLQRMREEFASKTELAQLQYDENLKKLEEFRQKKMLKEQEYNDLEQQIKADHEKKLAEIEKTKQEARLSAVAGAFGDLSTLMQTSNKKLFKIGQAAAIAEATVSGYQAAVTAWEKGMNFGGPPVAAAFTAASLLKTGALIANIKSQSPTGGGGGGSVGGGGGGGASAQAQTPTQTLNFTIQNDQFGYGERFARSIVSQLNAAQRNGSNIIGTVS